MARQQLHGHGVQHLVAHHHAAEFFGQGIHPAQLVGMRHQLGLLARAQAARQIDDGVALHPIAQRIQQLQRQPAATELLGDLGFALGQFGLNLCVAIESKTGQATMDLQRSHDLDGRPQWGDAVLFGYGGVHLLTHIPQDQGQRDGARQS